MLAISGLEGDYNTRALPKPKHSGILTPCDQDYPDETFSYYQQISPFLAISSKFRIRSLLGRRWTSSKAK